MEEKLEFNNLVELLADEGFYSYCDISRDDFMNAVAEVLGVSVEEAETKIYEGEMSNIEFSKTIRRFGWDFNPKGLEGQEYRISRVRPKSDLF